MASADGERNQAGSPALSRKRWWELPVELAVFYWLGSIVGIAVADLLQGMPIRALVPWAPGPGLVVDHRTDPAWLPEAAALTMAVRHRLSMLPLAACAVTVPLVVAGTTIVFDRQQLLTAGVSTDVRESMTSELLRYWLSRALVGGVFAGGWAAFRRGRVLVAGRRGAAEQGDEADER
jgi:hypothetical protein